MLFNSYFFIAAFLPSVLVVFFALGRFGLRRIAVGWLVAASLFFYGWWNPAYLGLIGLSILFNFTVGRLLGNPRLESAGRRGVLVFGVFVNIAVLAYYKYANFFVDNVNVALGTAYSFEAVMLPLGISFFTFTQIAYLVDAWRQEVREYDFLNYALFVTYFPHLIAGPVLHHKEMMPQFANARIFRFDTLNFAAGTTYFVLGLFKKVILADGIAVFASPVFNAAASGAALTFLDAWGGALAYTFQLYFDFSGYCDMAVGLALMMGVRLPLNFDSPYKSRNIIEFWRRWHMTLSRFLRDYLYVPLGGSRNGAARRYINLLVTMLLGGLWHGAGWTFIIWGALHGACLAINHGWQGFRRSLGQDPDQLTMAGCVVSTALTFLIVIVGWVYFRADGLDTAHRVLASMASAPSIELSSFYTGAVSGSSLARWGGIAGVTLQPAAVLLLCLLLLASIVFIAPNTQQIVGRFYWRPHGSDEAIPVGARTLWEPSRRWALVAGLVGACGLLGISDVSEFLYFQF